MAAKLWSARLARAKNKPDYKVWTFTANPPTGGFVICLPGLGIIEPMFKRTADQTGLSTPAIVIIVVVLVALAAVGWMVLGSNSDPEPVGDPAGTQPTQTGEVEQEAPDDSDEEAALSATHIVTYTNDGFSPANLTINQGDTVKFVNGSNRDFSPASNDHPSHTIYAGFDAREDLGPGESYSFTFERVGTWGYHNHELEGHTGTIVVQ